MQIHTFYAVNQALFIGDCIRLLKFGWRFGTALFSIYTICTCVMRRAFFWTKWLWKYNISDCCRTISKWIIENSLQNCTIFHITLLWELGIGPQSCNLTMFFCKFLGYVRPTFIINCNILKRGEPPPSILKDSKWKKNHCDNYCDPLIDTKQIHTFCRLTLSLFTGNYMWFLRLRRGWSIAFVSSMCLGRGFFYWIG